MIAVAPGPDICFVLAQSAGLGALAGLSVTAGLMTGLCVHILLAVVGMATLLQRAPRLATWISACGALYLFYVAWGMWQSTLAQIPAEAEALTLGDFYLRGIVLNLSNPKVILFFIAFLPKFIPSTGETKQPPRQTGWLLLLGVLFILCAGSVMSATALLGGALAQTLSTHPAAAQVLNRGAALAVAAIGVWILLPLFRKR